MSDETITITIDEDGQLRLETRGIVGPVCVEEARKLLEKIAIPVEIHKTDEYFMGAKGKVRSSLRVGRDRA